MKKLVKTVRVGSTLAGRKVAVMSAKDRILKIVHQHQKTPDLVSIRDLAKKLKMKQRDVLEAAQDLELNVNVGFGVVGGGTYKHERIGDYTLEDLDAPYS